MGIKLVDMLTAVCRGQMLAVLRASQSSLAGGNRMKKKVLPKLLSLPTQRELLQGREGRREGRNEKVEGRFRHIPVLYINRALGLWAVRLDMSHQHTNPF